MIVVVVEIEVVVVDPQNLHFKIAKILGTKNFRPKIFRSKEVFERYFANRPVTLAWIFVKFW